MPTGLIHLREFSPNPFSLMYEFSPNPFSLIYDTIVVKVNKGFECLKS